MLVTLKDLKGLQNLVNPKKKREASKKAYRESVNRPLKTTIMIEKRAVCITAT